MAVFAVAAAVQIKSTLLASPTVCPFQQSILTGIRETEGAPKEQDLDKLNYEEQKFLTVLWPVELL